ncbi:reverse transcriptase domain-containing protein [Tanacetum coccineum]
MQNYHTNQASSSSSLPSNTIPNPRNEAKSITTRSGASYTGPPIPPPVMEKEPEVTKDPELPSTEDIQPPLKLREKDDILASKFMEIFRNLHFELSFADALIHMPKFAPMFKKMLNNKDKLIELTKTPLNENCSAVVLKKLPEKLGDPGRFLIPCDFSEFDNCLALADLGASINLMPLSIWKKLGLPGLNDTKMVLELADRTISKPTGFSDEIAYGNPFPGYDLIVSNSSPTLTPFGDSDFLLLEEADTFLALTDDSTSPKVDEAYYDPEGDILLLESLLNSDPLPSLNQGNYLPEIKKELKVYNNKLPVIIAKDLSDDEKTALIKVLKSRKQAIAWKLSDIKGINLEFCSHKILMEEDYEPTVQHQRRVNPKIHDVIKKEVEKLLDAGLIYPISDRWRVCIDYRKLNEATRKDHFPLPFMDQMLERLAGNKYYCFLDGFSGYFQIPIDPNDQEKTTFTCPYGTFAYRRMPFGLCNAPGTSKLGKSHFMVKEGIILGHKISKKGIEVDKAKIDVIYKLPHPTTVKGIRSFLGHAGFYRRFIKDFSKISRPMTHLLEKNTPFIFSEDCILAFQTLKKKLTEAPILIAPNWDQPFELMCDETRVTSNVVYTDHSALKYLFNKKDAKARLLRWVLLLQEFDFKVIDTKGAENYAADHLSRLENPYENVFDPKEINETFPLETLNTVTSHDNQSTPWFADIANYHAGNFLIKGMSTQQKENACVFGQEALEILKACHEGPTGGHHSANITARKVFDAGFFWPTIYQDAHSMIKSCECMSMTRQISHRDEMPQNAIQTIDKVMSKILGHGVTHRLSTAYHLITRGQVE